MPPVARSDQPGGSGPLLPPGLAAEIQYWEDVTRLRAVDIAPAPAGALTASRQVILGGANAICGWSITETSGAAGAAIRLRDGASANDQVIARIDLAASESARDYLDRHGIRIETGMLWLEWISGSVEGVVWVR